MLDPQSLEVADLDHLQLLAGLWDDLSFSRVIDQTVEQDDQVVLPCSLALKALVLDITAGRKALYKVDYAWQSLPVELLLTADPAFNATQLNDDALGRCLDRIYDSGLMELYQALSLQVIKHEGVSVSTLHSDTTSKLVFGEYADQDTGSISVTQGHSKDHRPDLPQIMAGLALSTDGIPVLGQMLSENASDKTWQKTMLEALRSRLQVPATDEIVYVGDSALITAENLSIAHKSNIGLLGRLPATTNACGELIALALKDESKWEQVGPVVSRKDAASYQAMLFRREVLGVDLQAAVCRSDEPNERVIKRVGKEQQAAMDRAVKAVEVLQKEMFHCEADAAQALSDFTKKHSSPLIRLKTRIEERLEVGSFKKPGRPRKGEQPPTRQGFCVLAVIEEDPTAAQKQIRDESCFVLVHSGSKPKTAKEILGIYKGQMVAEKRFPFLKDDAMCDVFFVKNTKRLEALGYVMMLALLLWCVWEARVRRNLAASGEGPLVDVTRMKKGNPTAAVCSSIMGKVRVARVRTVEGVGPWQLVGRLTYEQTRVIRFSGSSQKLPHVGS